MFARTIFQASLCLALSGSISLIGLPVRAQEAAEPGAVDVVNLKNGGMIRGTILELLPNESVTIESAATGERKTFPWDEVASVERAGQTGGEAGPPLEAPPPVAEPVDVGPRVFVETSRPADVKLFEVTGEMVATGVVSGGGTATMHGIQYRTVCTAPCGVAVDGSRGQPFFFGGSGVTASNRFSLAGYSGDVVARVKPGRPGLRVGGLVAMVLGASGLVVGGTLFAFAKPTPQLEFDDMGNIIDSPEPEPNYVPAVAALVGGLALLGGGIAMFILGKTRFELQPRGMALGRRVRVHAGAGLTARF